MGFVPAHIVLKEVTFGLTVDVVVDKHCIHAFRDLLAWVAIRESGRLSGVPIDGRVRVCNLSI